MLQKIRPLLILLVLVSTPIVAYAQIRPHQPIEIRGQLRFADGGAPAADVVVRLDQLSGGNVNEVRTDRLGKFRTDQPLARSISRHHSSSRISGNST